LEKKGLKRPLVKADSPDDVDFYPGKPVGPAETLVKEDSPDDAKRDFPTDRYQKPRRA